MHTMNTTNRLASLLAWVDGQAESPALSQAAAAERVHLSPQAFFWASW